MKKILILIPVILIILFYAFKNNNAVTKYINLALKNKDLTYKTEFKDTKYICYFTSVYSISSIKPELERINAKYNPFIGLRMHTMRVGEGASSIVLVKNNGNIMPIYIDASILYTNDKVDYYRRCIPADKVNLRIENQKFYITH